MLERLETVWTLPAPRLYDDCMCIADYCELKCALARRLLLYFDV